MTARDRRYGTQSALVVLDGRALVQDFNFATTPERVSPPNPVVTPPTQAGVEPTPPGNETVRRPANTFAPRSRTVDSSAIGELAGPVDLASAIAGRIPGLLVTSANTPGGSTPMVFRGPRSFSGSVHPLVVVDGIPVDNNPFSTASQQFGLGGFDYGSPLQDLALDDIASITLLDAGPASARYGSRAANGVLLVTTKQAGAMTGLKISATQRFTGESAIRLPSFQNQYGQGLGGQFEFFDGMGGGINDAVDQSWGPALQGQPVVQASLTEPRRPDVRPWVPHSSGVRNYFGDGRTFDANVAVTAGRETDAVRAAVNVRDASGVTPGASARRLGLTLGGSVQPASNLSAGATIMLTSASAHRAGTGFDEANPVSGFLRMGRQVDLVALRANLKDSVEQINWIYTARNNPFFQSQETSNDDKRTHTIAGGHLTYAFRPTLNATLLLGTDDYGADRNFDVASGWKGGYPTALGRGSFAGGGSQLQKITTADRLVALSVATLSHRALGWNLDGTAGVERRSSKYRMSTAVSDRPSTVGAAVPSSDIQTSSNGVTSLYVTGAFSRASHLTVDASARLEKSSAFASADGTAIFPSLTVTYDLAQRVGALKNRLGDARLRAAWWRAGNEITERSLAQTYAGGGTTTTPTLGVPTTAISGAERASGVEIGGELAPVSRRYGLDFTVYRERSTQLLIGMPDPSGNALGLQSGEVFNGGYEVQLRAVPLDDGAGSSWDLIASLSRNSSTVDQITGDVGQAMLSPSIWGTGLAARVGHPLGSIVGTRYLRNASGQMVLSNGLPIPDASDAFVVLGSPQPDWSGSLRSRMRYGGFEIGLLFDARMGGHIFSATNLWGSYAGTLTSTIEGRENGMVIAGVDSVSGTPNTTSVSAEDYFHSLAAISEAFVYDASYAKLREARITYELPLPFLKGFRGQALRVSLFGRNIMTWAKAPNIDPETALSSGVFQGFEMGQLPNTRSLGFQLSIAP